MFRFLAILLLLFVVGVGAIGNNECIQIETAAAYHGFSFKNCAGDAKLSMKWKKESDVKLSLWADSKDVRKFKLVVNDECILEFEGKKGDGEYAKWTNENGKVASCASADNCDLKINKNGKLLTYTDDVDVGCNDVHKKIDETWVWSKFRVENLPVEYKFMITLRGTKEGTEYTPSPISTKKPTTNEPTIEESFTEEPTTEEPTTLANSETANSTTSHNSALSTRLGSSIFVLVSLFFVVL